ncbi:hypothetical protein MACJ_002703 [Theileria orientalis]|uniref:SfiI-subtelomeric related protein family member n=1 Tax=Theileria orientalis TaxID=68886 RepID=A0A976QQP8_THEOR|nr:hypothetical protein MACJ_002703 [Theileria orientalis]
MKLNLLHFCTIVTLVLFEVDLLTYIDATSFFDDDSISVVDSRSGFDIIDRENVPIIESYLPSEFSIETRSYKPPEDIKPRLLIVDIQNKQGNNLLQYQRDDSNSGDIYTAVTPNLIFKIIDKNQVLWKSKGINYPYKVFVGDEFNNERQIQAYFPPGDNEELDYTQPTEREFHNTLLEIDIEVKTTDQYVIYKRDPVTFREKFTCRPGYLIYKIYSGLKLMTEASNNKYFDRVVIYKDEFGNRNMQGLIPGQIDEGDVDEPLPVYTPPNADFTLLQSEVLDHENHLVYVNVKNRMSTKFVTYEVDTANNVEIFTAREPYRFALVMNGSHRAWKYKHGEYPNQALLFKDKKNSPFLRLGFPRAVSKFPKPKLITLDVRNIESNHEFSYEYDAPNQTQIFRPKPGFLIDKVMKGELLIWKCEDFIYPETVLILPDENGEPALRLQFPNEVTRESLPAIPEPEPEPMIERVHPSRTRATMRLPGSVTESSEHILSPRPKESMRLPDSEPEIIERLRPFRPKEPTGLPHSEPETMVKSDQPHGPEPRIRVLVPQRAPKSKQAKLSRSESRVRLGETDSTVEHATVVPTTYKSGDYIYKKDPIHLYLDFTKKSDLFKYETYVANHTYTPTAEHLFDKVALYDFFGRRITTLWEAKTPDEYAYKVEQFGFNHVLVYMNTGAFALLYKDEEHTWTSHEYPKEKESEIEPRMPEYEVVQFDEKGKVDSSVLLKKLIHIDIAHKWNTFVSGYTKVGNRYTFRAGEGFTISGVMDSSAGSYLGEAVPIWDTGDPTQFCESVEHEVTEDILTLNLMDGSKKLYKKVGKKWLDFMFDHTVDNTKKLPFVLNLTGQSRFATYEFDSDVDNKSMTCTVKEGYAIKEVVWLQSEYQFFRFDKNVWSTEDPLYFARRVLVKNLGFGQKVVNIDLFNGLQLTFHRSVWGLKWDFMGSKVVRRHEIKSTNPLKSG